MALNIEGLIELADRLDQEGKHKEAAELDEMLQKLATEWDELSPEEQQQWLERQDWHKDPIGFINKPSESLSEIKEKMESTEEESSPERGELTGAMEQQMAQRLSEMGAEALAAGSIAKDIVDDLERQGLDDEVIQKMVATKMYKSFEKALEEAGISSDAFRSTLMGSGGLVMETNPETGRFETKKESSEDLPGVEKSAAPIMPGYSPGAFDIESPHRLQPFMVELQKKIKELNLEPEKEKGLTEVINQYLETTEQPEQPEQQGESETVTDEESLEAVKEREQSILGPAGLTEWPENEDYKLAALRYLAGLADRLDKVGATAEADLIDGVIQKHATDVEHQPEGDTEQSKRYDSKYHHSLQVREPKTKQERIDREGRDKHHVHTMQNVSATGLSTRYCPEHIGVMVTRISESTYQCPLDGQIYNYETGWTDHDGNEHPGGSVAAQTPDSSGYAIPHRIFDSRENISNRVN